MADEADHAAIATDQWLASARQAHHVKSTALKPRGSCHNCDHVFTHEDDGPLFAQLLYCDVDCRKDHEERLKRGMK